ncbi:MAG: hypothetical protein MI784_10325 [Cytophagales bacterium]|nr:hypothetical protein [Cytophagales bacterium]
MFSPKRKKDPGFVPPKNGAGPNGAYMNDQRAQSQQEADWIKMMQGDTSEKTVPDDLEIVETSQPEQTGNGQVFYLKDARGREYMIKLSPDKGALERENFASNFINDAGGERIKAPESQLIGRHSEGYTQLLSAAMNSDDLQSMQLAKLLDSYQGENVLFMEKMPGRKLEAQLTSKEQSEEDMALINRPATLWAMGETLAFDIVLGNSSRLISGQPDFGNMLFDDASKEFSLTGQSMSVYGQRQGVRSIAPEEFKKSKTSAGFSQDPGSKNADKGHEWEVMDYKQAARHNARNPEIADWEFKTYGQSSLGLIGKMSMPHYAKKAGEGVNNVLQEMLDMFMQNTSGQGRAVSRVCELIEGHCGVAVAHPEIIGAGFVNALKNIGLMMRKPGTVEKLEERKTNDFDEEVDALTHSLVQIGNMFANNKFLKKVEGKLNKEKKRMEREEGLKKIRKMLNR